MRYKIGDKLYDGIATIAKYSQPQIIKEGYNIIDINDNQEYMLHYNNTKDAFYYIKNSTKYYLIWG